jgi:hypothetical protein
MSRLASIGHDGVTVMHGRVREFSLGVAVGSEVGRARHNRVLDISSSKNDFFGIGFFGVARSLVRNSSGSRNPAPDGDGMGLFGEHLVRDRVGSPKGARGSVATTRFGPLNIVVEARNDSINVAAIEVVVGGTE